VSVPPAVAGGFLSRSVSTACGSGRVYESLRHCRKLCFSWATISLNTWNIIILLKTWRQTEDYAINTICKNNFQGRIHYGTESTSSNQQTHYFICSRCLTHPILYRCANSSASQNHPGRQAHCATRTRNQSNFN
jgi:hypothetical protein